MLEHEQQQRQAMAAAHAHPASAPVHDAVSSTADVWLALASAVHPVASFRMHCWLPSTNVKALHAALPLQRAQHTAALEALVGATPGRLPPRSSTSLTAAPQA